LSLDVRIQRLTEQALVGQTGAAVVVDPANGVSSRWPARRFRSERVYAFIPERRWAELLADHGKPLLNKAVGRRVRDGSTFKPVVAMASPRKTAVATPQTPLHARVISCSVRRVSAVGMLRATAC
jgi:cell division protein FtsI/penicillin-binding protein 2